MPYETKDWQDKRVALGEKGVALAAMEMIMCDTSGEGVEAGWAIGMEDTLWGPCHADNAATEGARPGR